jgi:hypothetical protein
MLSLFPSSVDCSGLFTLISKGVPEDRVLIWEHEVHRNKLPTPGRLGAGSAHFMQERGSQLICDRFLNLTIVS